MESVPTMDMSSISNSRSNWALAVIDAAGHIEGVTRLQKYSFLIAKRIKGITGIGFYDDWQPSKYGPFSGQLADDVQYLENQGLITDEKKPNKYGYDVEIITPSERAASRVNEMYNKYTHYYDEIKKILDIYQHKSLMDVLHDVYYLYPYYASQSTIKAQVGRKIVESDSYLNREYDDTPNE